MTQLIFNIQDMTWDGRGVSRTPEGRVVMISGALPGDSVTAHLAPTESRGPLLGIVDELITPSPDRVNHPCQYHARGCLTTPLGDWRYEAALAWKARHLGQTLRRIGGLIEPVITDPIPSPRQWGYRERLELHLFQVYEQWWLGYLTPDGYFPLKDCLLGTDPVRQALSRLVFALGSSVENSAWNPPMPLESRKNSPRLVIRDNGHGEAVAVLFIRNSEGTDLPVLRQALHHAEFAGWQIRHAPSMKLRFMVSQLIDAEGRPHLHLKVADRELTADPVVFSQVNREAAALLTQRIMDELPDQGAILDLYGGYGAFALDYSLSKGGQAVVVEASIPAVRTGQAFAREQGLPVEYFTADLASRRLPVSMLKRRQAVILDPPRAGASLELIELLNEAGPPLVIYVSCHPASLARDVKLLRAYRPRSFTPVDLFPQTPDLETVALLDRIAS
jgi:23S rRNA (uracil1939-C5)-methyltransferase